jgi:nitrate/nitrite-specific signal transduction histidine kinase
VPQEPLSDQTSARRTQDYQGQDIVASYASVAGTSWTLVAEESWADLTAGSRSYQNFLILLLLLGVIAPALVVGIGTRRVMQPIDDLIQAAKQVAQGNFGQTINAQTGDEIEELSRQFNMMSAQLHESYTNLEKRVADRTMELATLNAIAAVTSRTLDLQEILDDALSKTLEALAFEAGGVYLLQDEGDLLFAAAHQGIGEAAIAELDRQQADEEYLGRVVQTCEPLIVDDASQDPILACLIASEPDFHSVAYIPLISRQRVLGVMFAVTKGYRVFSDQEIELLTSIGQQVGVVVENAWLFAKAEQRLQELEALYRADEELYRHLRLEQVFQTLVNVALDILQADKSSLMVWDDRMERLVVRASRGFSPKTLEQMSFSLGEGTAGLAAATGEPAIVEDTSEDPRVLKHIIEPEGIRSLMNVPIKIAGRVFGVFNVDYTQPRAYGEEEKRLFIALAQRAALTIENAQLYEQAQQAAVLEERQRLARDLHDAVTQTLFSASLIAEVLPRLWEHNIEEGWRRLEELRQLTRGALAEMRTLLVELRPSAILEAEMNDLLRQLTEAVTARARVASVVEIEAEFTLPDDVKVAFYRIAQEALNNVVKHAEASNVHVSLTETSGVIEMCISDDGCGYNPEDVSPEHLGLGIMRERAEFVGADLEVETQVDCGTKVLVRWERDRGSEESA